MEVEKIREWANTVTENMSRVIYGKREVMEKLLVALLCRGHALIEDVPGVGKTILARALALSLGGDFKRIQCTPDLLPVDVTGVSIYNPKEGEFTFRPGPLQANIVLVDEINRATPRTQSALLEAMAENQISVEGKSLPLPEPFFLMATENPVEFEGTFPLPEAQKDRFFLSVTVGYPPRDSELTMLVSQRRLTHPVVELKSVTDVSVVTRFQEMAASIYVDDRIAGYILDLVEGTRQSTAFQLGVSPRGSLALYKGAQALAAVRGRDYVIIEDVKELYLPVCSKRVILSPESHLKNVGVEKALGRVMESTAVPVLGDVM
ncbi:MAG: MoxR family ATPase [Spirochaetales bacterium]|nr:MoxR family ATPase [Spirochaetales bacterium]